MSQDETGQAQQLLAGLKAEISKAMVGQQAACEALLVALIARGHVLLEGVPGVAKTLLARSLARAMDLQFKRVQFTPDLMPSDITGTEILQEDKQSGQRELRFVKGPIFANLVLADEINRTPPKTQAALLQAMQEHHVTVAGHTFELPRPFFVLGTQNPIESEGTYPLPEAQQDRFMFKVFVRYPTFQEEFEIARRTTGLPAEEARPVLSAADIIGLQQAVRGVPVSDHLVRYALAQLLNKTTDLECCGEADGVKTARAAVGTLDPDFVLLDLSLGDGDGYELIGEWKRARPAMKIVVISRHDEAVYAERSLRSGADGFITDRKSVV